jgi:hypothetical protein
MTRIAKKRRSVKRQKRAKPPPSRFTIRKDSLDRRYAIDKQTGRRVSVQKAERERKQRRKAIKPILRHKTPKALKPSKKRSEAAKRGWATRKARSIAAKKGWETRRKTAAITQVVPISVLTPPERLGIPPGVRMVPLYTGVADRMLRYPKVKEAVENAFTQLQIEAWNKLGDKLAGRKPPKLTREQQIESNIRDLIAERITEPSDIDRVLEQLWDELDQEYTMRELYSLYFSPEVA